MANSCGGEDFDLWRGLKRIEQQAAAQSLEEADRMRDADGRDEQRGRALALAAVVVAYLVVRIVP